MTKFMVQSVVGVGRLVTGNHWLPREVAADRNERSAPTGDATVKLKVVISEYFAIQYCGVTFFMVVVHLSSGISILWKFSATT